MSRMKRQLALQAARIDALPPGRRLLLFGALLLVLVLAWQQFWAGPVQRRKAALAQQIDQTQTLLGALQAQASAAGEGISPEAARRQERQNLEQELASLHGSLQEATGDLVSPQEMAPLLEELLRHQQGIRLVRLESLGSEALLPSEEGTGAARPGLFRHAMRLELEGGYLPALRYLQQLEKLPKRLIWENLEIRVEEYPTARIVLTVYTLSLSRGWIGV